MDKNKIKVKKVINDRFTHYVLIDNGNIVIGEQAFKSYVELVGAENLEIDIINNKSILGKDNPNMRKKWENLT